MSNDKVQQWITDRKKSVDDEARKIYRQKDLIKQIKLYYDKSLFLEKFNINYLDDWNVNAQGKDAKSLMIDIKHVAEIFIEQVDASETVHAFLYGASGRGKSFLSNIIMCELVKRYKKCLFLNTLPLKNVLSNVETRNEYFDLIENADLIVIDELGAEATMRQSGDQASTRWQQILYHLLSLCEDKNLIVTTNLAPEELQKVYNPNLYSRIMKHIDNVPNDEKTFAKFIVNMYNSAFAYDLRHEEGSGMN